MLSEYSYRSRLALADERERQEYGTYNKLVRVSDLFSASYTYTSVTASCISHITALIVVSCSSTHTATRRKVHHD